MSPARALSAAVVSALLASCNYVVVPEQDPGERAAARSKGWAGEVIKVEETAAGDLRVEFAVRNDTTDWSAMKAGPRPAVLRPRKGPEVPCETVQVSSGGHRLAPGFRMRAFIAGKKLEPRVQPIAVECKGVKRAAGAKLLVPYSYVTGMYNYYEQEKNKVEAVMELELDEVRAGLTYPIAEPVKDLVVGADARLSALNGVVLTLEAARRVEKGVAFDWATANPGEYPTYVHVGTTPVIGQDGVLYGFYESPDLASVPISPGQGGAEWTTTVAVPPGVKGLHIMLSVETGKQRQFQNYAVDVSGL
jgi:hypothetical protein